MRACAINREAAALQGIQVSRMLALSFALSAALGALAGILITPTQFTAFNVGMPFAISGFIAAIVGGFGRPLGAFIGGIVLGLAQALAVLRSDPGSRTWPRCRCCSCSCSSVRPASWACARERKLAQPE